MCKLQSHYWSDGLLPVHYLTAGNPSHPPMIFFHGFMGTGRDWSEIINHFSGQYFCIAPDLPGHGKTFLDLQQQALAWKDLGAIFYTLIGSLTKEKIIGAGYSMGGRVVLYMAVTFPSLFKALIIESASPGLKTAREKKVRIFHDQSIASKLENTDFNEFLENWYRQPLFLSLYEHPAYANMLKQRKKENPKQLAAALRLLNSGVQPSLWKELKNIKIPLLLLSGEADLKYSALLSEMQQRCPNADLHIVGQTGHNIHFENPLVFLEYMSNFLDQIGENPS